MRIQEESWRARHFPLRDAVFKAHDECYYRYVTTSAMARVVQKRCKATQSHYSSLKCRLNDQIESFNSVCQKKLDLEVLQFNPEKRMEQVRMEEKRRVVLNGGKALDYVLMPRRFSREPSLMTGAGDEENYYKIPIIFDRLSKRQPR